MKAVFRFGVVSLTLLSFCTISTEAAFAEAGMKLRNRIRISKKSYLTGLPSADAEEDSSLTQEKAQLLAQKRKGLIQDIRRFIRESKSADQVAELNLRLGGLYLEEYRFENGQAQIQYEKVMNDFKAKNPKKGAKAPTFDNSEAIASLDKARAIYRDLSTRFRNHPRRDEMLYFLALTSMDRGKTAEGIATFDRLAKDHPNSRYVNDALVQLGDHYFDNNKFKQAEGYFDAIISKKYRALLPYAVYKKGWCAYNTQRASVALNHFKWVITHEQTQQQGGSSVRVRQEALRDITLPFVDLKLVDESIQFFDAQGDPYQRTGLETMASLYFEQGDYQNATVINEKLLSLDPNYKKNPGYDLAVIEALRMRNHRPQAMGRLFERMPLYLTNSNWYEINASQPETVKGAAEQYEEITRKYATELHAEGQRSKSDAMYDSARVLYAKYLEFFPSTQHTPQMRFNLAEIQFRQKQFLPAANNYYAVYKSANSIPSLKYDAIRYTLTALAIEVNEERRKQGLSEIKSSTTAKIKDKEDAVLEAQAFSPVEGKLIEVADEYLTTYPKAKDAANILYEQAYLYYTHYEFIPAYKSFWKLTQEYSKDPTAYSSAFLILDILNRRKEYPKMVLACKKFLDTKAMAQADFRNQIGNILRHSELKRIAQIEEKQEYKEAAEAYLEYTQAYGKDDESLFEKALYNASVDYMKAGLLLSAVDTQEKFLRRFPHSGLRENMLLQVAKTYESLAMLEKSAVYFMEFAKTYPTHSQSQNALRLAGLYYWGSGNAPKAETIMKSFLAMYPKDKKFVESDLIGLYESQDNAEKLVQYFLHARAERGLATSEYLAYTLRIAEIQARTSRRIQPRLMEEALTVVRKFHKDLAQTPRGVEGMSKILFWYANQKEDVFYRIKLALPQKSLEMNLQRKMTLLKELEKEYASISKLGGDWGLGGIYKTSALYSQMAKEVVQAPVPGELSAEQVELYRAELDKAMVKPFREKALSLVGQCLDKAQEFNLLSSWTSKCYALASELEANRYPLVKTFYLPAQQVAVLVPTEPESKTALGDFKNYRYPYTSSGLFQQNAERVLASAGPVAIPSLYGGMGIRFDDSNRAIPSPVNYHPLMEARKKIVESSLSSEKSGRKTTFTYLHLLRLMNPQRAIVSIQEAIRNDPNNIALHNLLALAYMDGANLPAAKVTWLSLVARGNKTPQIWNNLGVLEQVMGNEPAAIAYFQEATQMDSKEALINLGYLALKYRNGFEAKRHFDKALQMDKSLIPAEVGMGVARIQNREFEAAKNLLSDAKDQFKNDPLTYLSFAYFLMDAEKEPESAHKVLTEYTQQQGMEQDKVFREALMESQGGGASGREPLPGIE